MAYKKANTSNSNVPLHQQMAMPDRGENALDNVQSSFTETEPIIVDNDGLEVLSETIIVLSDAPKHKNIVVLPAIKSAFTEETVEKTFDTKIWQLLTKEGEGIADEVEPTPSLPLEKPQKLFIRGRNYRWIVSEGRAKADRWNGHEPWVPAGIESKGHVANPLNPTLLYAPDDHALFYPREVVNYVTEEGNPTRKGLTWEWKFNGNVISTEPYAMISNIKTQGESWRDVSTPHKILCTVSNEHGSVSEEMNFIVADNILDNDGNPMKIVNEGWYVFDNEKYWNHGTDPINFIEDPKAAPRTLIIKKLQFDNYGGPNSGASYFKKDHWDNAFKKEAQYRVNGGPWILARDVFTGRNKPWRAHRFHENDSVNKVTATVPGGTEAFIEFRYVYKYFAGKWPFKRKYYRHYEASMTFQAPTDDSTHTVIQDTWTIYYRDEYKGRG